MTSPTVPDRVTLKTTSGYWIPIFSWAVLALLWIDMPLRGQWGLAFRYLPGFLAIALGVWIVLWYPTVFVKKDRVVVRNPLSLYEMPYGAVSDVRVGTLLSLNYEDESGRQRKVTAWNAPGLPRTRPRRRGDDTRPQENPLGASGVLVSTWERWNDDPDRRAKGSAHVTPDPVRRSLVWWPWAALVVLIVLAIVL